MYLKTVSMWVRFRLENVRTSRISYPLNKLLHSLEGALLCHEYVDREFGGRTGVIVAALEGHGHHDLPFQVVESALLIAKDKPTCSEIDLDERSALSR